MKSLHRTLGLAVACLCLTRGLGAQQARSLSLEDALRMSQLESEALRIAEAGVTRAEGQQLQARSQYLPQINGSAGYTRTLATQFSAFAEASPTPPPGTPPVPPRDTTSFFAPCNRYLAPAGATDAERIRALELFSRCSLGGGLDFSRVGFGAKNQYQLGAQGSLTLWSGGRVQAQNRAAQAGRRSADIEVAAQRAQLALQVTQAYYDAVLADRLVQIAESALVQTEGTLTQTTLARQIGNQSEFELLRAQVTRDNQLPQLIQRRTERDLAYLRFKQLVNLPYGEDVRLTTNIDEPEERQVRTVASIATGSELIAPDTSVDARAPVRQLNESVRAQEAQLAVANSEWLPTVSLTSSYSRLAFGSAGVPSWGNWLNNWTVSLGASFPLFSGGRIKGDQMIARAGLEESKARLDQTRELAALDAQQSFAQLRQAEAALAASAGTAQQAARAYTIADVRYREGISTQLELSESRLLLEQSRANRAVAARNLQVARVRLALLRDLPLGTGAGAGGVTTGLGGFNAVGSPTGGVQSPATPQVQGTRTTPQQASATQIPQ